MEDSPSLDQTLPGGLRVVCERSERSAGVALALRIPAGAKDDPSNKYGLANLVKETLFRATKKKNARKLADAFDYYGIRHSEYTGTEHTTIQVQCLAEHLDAALGLLREVLSLPAFPQAEFETARIQSIQELKHLDDDPMSKVFVLLKQLYLGSGWGHSELGSETTLPEITRDDVLAFWKAHYIPAGSICAVVGKFDPEAVQKQLDGLFANRGEAWPRENAPAAPASNAVQHENKDSEQTQIALAFPCVPRRDEQHEAARLAVGVLGGGMSSRLFTEVREKRALVYSVGAQASSMRDAGLIYAYAGTTAPRAKETLEVIRAELRRLGQDLTQEELDRARVGVKANLLMDQESTAARARELLDSVFFEDRVVSLQESIDRLNGVTVKQVCDYWNAHPPEPYALATIGNAPLGAVQ
ncbi:MAG TPA: pitrilysin family protein [Planctomycetota bacterium]|nr:pitrilysin family protein [Planctomycetota bacterium]